MTLKSNEMREYKKGSVSVIIIFVLLTNISLVQLSFTKVDLEFIKIMHQEYCLLSPVCKPPTFQTLPPPVLSEDGSYIVPGLPIPFPDPAPPEWTDGSCCEDCSCDIDRCTPSGSCCPDLLESLPSIQESISKIKVECIYASLKKSITDSLRGLSVWMFTKCADDFKGEQITKLKCENPDEFTEWKTKFPVADNVTQDSFQNYYCAQCNNVLDENIVYWAASLQCSKGKLMPSSMETLVSEVNSAPDCNIIFKLPQIGMMLPLCTPKISKCNMTGRWKLYDPIIEAGCHAYTAVYEHRYNNIFCYLCNEPEPYSMPAACVRSDPGKIGVSFSALLKFTKPKIQSLETVTKAETECDMSQILDPVQNKCRDLSCLPPKVLAEGTCTDTVEYLTGVTYEVFLKLTPINTTIQLYNLHDVAADAWAIYQEYLHGLGVSDLLYYNSLYYESSNDSVVQCFVLHCKVYFDYYHTISSVFVNKLLDIQNDNRAFIGSSAQAFIMTLGYYVQILADNDSTFISPKGSTSILHHVRSNAIMNPVPDFVYSTESTLVTKVLGCPGIELKAENDSLEKRANESLINYLKKKFPTGSYRVVNGSSIIAAFVCADDFLAVVHQLQESRIDKRPSYASNSPQVILSFVCTCISLLCLLITLITYMLFPDLRTQPGINNMALVTNLIVAQALFQFGSNRADSIPDWGCQFIGVLVHFFWLMVIFWMNVCSIHMFLVFVAIKRLSVCSKPLKQTIIYTAYTVIASLSLVLLNILVSHFHLDMNSLGYGGTLCYIADYRMVAYSFALPVGCIVIFNLILFLIVVVKICRMPTVSSENKHTRNFFTIYAKLSTLTGVTWIFGFVHILTGIVALEYFHIISNASQGVFIFIAFVCNSRVLGMYRNRAEYLKSFLPDRLIAERKSVVTDLTEIHSFRNVVPVTKK